MQCAPESEDVSVNNNPTNSSINETSQPQFNLGSQVQVVTLPSACFPQEGTVLLIPVEICSQVFSNSIEQCSQENGNSVSIIEWQPASQTGASKARTSTSILPVESPKTYSQTTSLVPVSIANNMPASRSSDSSSLTGNTIIIDTAQFELLKNMASDNAGVKTGLEAKENNTKGPGKSKLTLEQYRKLTGMHRVINRKIAANSLTKSVSGPSLSQTVSNVSNSSTTNGSEAKVGNGSEVSSAKAGKHYVVCNYCGFSSYNLEKCGRCQRKVCSEWKVRPQPLSSTLTVQEPKYQEWVRRSCSSESCPEARKTVVVRRQTRQAEEPPCLTLSSDEEDANSSLLQTPKSMTSTDSSSAESQIALTAFNMTPEELASKNLEEIMASKIGTQPYVSVRCRGARFGPYKTVLKDDVFFTEYLIFMKATRQDSQENELVWLKREELTSIDVCFTASSPIAFIRCSLDCPERIAKQLNINISNEDSLKCFIVLMLDFVSESAQLSLKQMYSGILREISDAFAQNQLFSTTGVKADAVARSVYERKVSTKRPDQGTEQESTTADRPILENDTSTWLIWPPPPSRDGISISGQDYLCLEPDTFLNDVIIDFYLKYLVNSVLSEEQREKTHVFSCFFYQRLTTKPKTSRKKHPIEDDPKYTAAEKRHHRVKSWTKNVDLFSKDFLIIPINESSHWFLAIVCFPGLVGTAATPQGKATSTKPAAKSSDNTSQSPSLLGYTLATGQTVVIGATSITPVGPTGSSPNRGSEKLCLTLGGEERDEAISDEEEEQDEGTKIVESLAQNNAEDTPPNSQNMPDKNFDNNPDSFVKQPCILVFDSMAGCSRSRVIATLRDYLQVEHNVRKKDARARTFTKDTIKGVNVRVPQQTNSSDCGIYVLQYVESFFKNPIKSFKIPLPSLRDWFSCEEVGSKRQQLQQLIVNLVKDVNPDFVVRIVKKASVDGTETEGAIESDKLTQDSGESTASGTTVSAETEKELEKASIDVNETKVNEEGALISGNSSPVLSKKVSGMSRKRHCKGPSEQAASDDTKQVNGTLTDPSVMPKKPKTDTSGV